MISETCKKSIKLIPFSPNDSSSAVIQLAGGRVAHLTIFPMFKDMEKSFYEGPEKN